MTRLSGAEDLLVLARQNLLAEDAERRFDVAVQSSRELELLYQAGVGFDAEAQLMPGDETRSAALVARTLAALDQGASSESPRVARRSRYGGLVARALGTGVLLGLLLSVALAGAWEYAEKRRQAERAAKAPTASSALAAPVQARALTPVSAPGAATLAPISSADEPPETSMPVHARASSSSSNTIATRGALIAPTPNANATSASELFARANAARRSGDIEAALTQYRELAVRYPASDEAEDAKVLIGKLLLSQRSPRAALHELESYHGDALADEALWARAEALRKLGSADERAALSELVARHPDSPYAEAARKRLRELGQ